MPIVEPRTFTLTLDGGTPIEVLEVTMHPAPVTYAVSDTASLPDPEWTHTDSHGHEHRWADTHPGPDLTAALPTLAATIEHVQCDGACDDGSCEGYDLTTWHCAKCGDQVIPGTVPDFVARTTGVPVVTGPATATVVIGRDPRHGDTSPRVYDAVLRDASGAEIRGNAGIGTTEIRRTVEGAEMRITVEMAIDA